MDGRVSITITTDKPITVRVTEDSGRQSRDSEGKQAAGLKRLLEEVKGGQSDVADKNQSKQTANG